MRDDFDVNELRRRCDAYKALLKKYAPENDEAKLLLRSSFMLFSKVKLGLITKAGYPCDSVGWYYIEGSLGYHEDLREACAHFYNYLRRGENRPKPTDSIDL